ncbi:MAG: glycosyltransferase family 25 protein [bacterium]
MSMFDKVYVLNLDRRPERLRSFWKGYSQSGWPFQTPERVSGLDGSKLPLPAWWTQTGGALGCLFSYFRIFEDAITHGHDAIFVFEDDCTFSADCSERILPFMDSVPSDWEQIYLGGLLRGMIKYPPSQVNEHVVALRGITGTWATGYRLPFMQKWYKWAWEHLYNARPLGGKCHLDWMFCSYQCEFAPKVYAPHPWICGMMPGASDICWRVYSREHFFNWTDNHVDLNSEIISAVNDQVLFPLAQLNFNCGNGPFSGEVSWGVRKAIPQAS